MYLCGLEYEIVMKMKFGIVGLGNIGKRHAEHIMKQEEAEWVAYCDLIEFSNNHKIPTSVAYYDSIDEMLLKSELDIVCVCTPNYLHHIHTLKALQAGCHVVCEKPMAISTVQCNEMIDVATQTGKTIFVVKQNRYNDPVQKVKQLLNNQQLGKIYFVQVNCFWNRNEYYYNESPWRGKKELDGGCLFTQFSHFIDILYYLFGMVNVNARQLKNYNHAYTEVEDTGSFIMETASGAMVNFNFSTCSFEKNMEGAITILAEKGTVKIGGQYLNTIEYQHIEDVIIPEINIQAKSNDYGKYQGSMSNHDKMIDNVIKTLQGKATIMTNANEGRDVVKIIEAMYG
jgi:UDP-N-acetyl-2-amino-2-deoxyglucuronate dehydrogenase